MIRRGQLERICSHLSGSCPHGLFLSCFPAGPRATRGLDDSESCSWQLYSSIAILISIAFWHAEWEALIFARDFRIYYILDRMVWVTLALFVVGTWLFFRNYPVAIAPNVVRHTYIAAVYFGVTGMCHLAFTLVGIRIMGAINLVIVIVAPTCFTAWAILLTRTGQITPSKQQVSLEDTKRIERINDELLVFMGNVPKHDR